MILYTKGHEQIEFDDIDSINSGNCANIYRYNDTVLKVYKKSCNYHLKMKKINFDLLKKIDAPAFVKLKEYFFVKKISSYISKRLYAYTMEYIEEEKILLLERDKEFILYLVERLDESIKRLSFYDYILDDIKPKNLIINSSGITLNYLDLYDRRRWTNYSAYIINKARMIDLLNY